MALFNLFKLPKHQKFDYKPRFWDKEKDEFEERLRRARSKADEGVEGMKDRISSGFRNSSYHPGMKFSGKRTFYSNILLIIILFVLILLTYIFLVKYFPHLITFIEK